MSILQRFKGKLNSSLYSCEEFNIANRLACKIKGRLNFISQLFVSALKTHYMVVRNTHTHTHTHERERAHTHTHEHEHTHMYTGKHTHIHVHTYIHMNTYTHIHVRTHKYTLEV